MQRVAFRKNFFKLLFFDYVSLSFQLSNDERQLQECYGKRFSVDKKYEHHKKRARLEERNEGALTNLLTQVKQIPTLQQKLQQQQQEG